MPKVYWCSPAVVDEHYRSANIKFVLRNLIDIKLGLWPPKDRPDGTDNKSYVESPGELPAVVDAGPYGVSIKGDTIAFSLSASEIAINIAVEVERRIDATGRDGWFARAIYTQGLDYWELAKKEHLEPEDVEDRVKNAIKYASGKRRKTKPYYRWIRDEDCHRKQRGNQL